MKMTGNTVLITGGTSGIGLELAGEFLSLGNKVIVTGRDQKKLENAKKTYPTLHTIQSDVSDPAAIKALFDKIVRDFPEMNVLINNAGIMRKIDLQADNSDLTKLTQEIEINFMGPVRMTTQFLAHLKAKPHAAIVNVSSGLAFVPMAISPIYCGTKAALHSYTQSLRMQLKNTNITVFELAPPGTETPLFSDEFTKEDVGGVKTMPVNELAKHTIKGMSKGTLEIRPGLSNVLNVMSRVAPGFIAGRLGKGVDLMHAKSSIPK